MNIDTNYTGKSGLYVCAKPLITSNAGVFTVLPKQLSSFLVSKHIDFTLENDLHVTLVYNASARVKGERLARFAWLKEWSPTTEFGAIAAGLRSWESNNKFYIGIVWSSQGLANVHYALSRNFHLVSSFPSFLCHTTIGYIQINGEVNLKDLQSAYTEFEQRFNNKVTYSKTENNKAVFSSLTAYDCKQ